MSIAPGTRIGDRYVVGDRLGAGGMGEVYRANDERLGREVALKVLPPQIAGEPAALARLEREARAAARLSHPGIVTLFDVFAEGAGAFLTMELVAGQPLRASMGGPLPAARAVEIARQLADALAHAHAAGVVHRDLKPENVMVSADGRVRILDFGLAVTSEASVSAGPDELATALRLTRPGMVVGTVAYMSPEQATGGVVDGRTDQFALGVVLHEMLAGRRPFGGSSVVEVLTAILRGEPAALPPAVDLECPGVQAVVGRCLAREPRDRYPDTTELATALQGLAPNVSPQRRPSDAPRRGRWTGLALVAVALLALAVSGVRLLRQSGSPRRPDAQSSVPGALEAYRQAHHHALKEDWREQDRSIPLFERAVDLDPSFGAAWSEIAEQYVRKVFEGDPERTWEGKAVLAIGRALDLNPDAPEALVARGNLAYTKASGFPLERVAADYRHALAVDPENARVHEVIAYLYIHAGLLDRALQHLEIALRLKPTSGSALARVARIYWYQGRYEEALAGLQSRPQTARHFEVPIILLHLGRDAEARRLVESTLHESLAQGRELPNPSDLRSSYAVVLARAGDAKGAEEQIQTALRQDDGGSHFHHAAYNLAVAYALLGRKDEAVAMLERVAREGMPCYPLFAKDSFLDGLRDHAAFRELLARLKTQHAHFEKTL
jgi:serine/threonine protein kinase/lipoprotein NlpI